MKKYLTLTEFINEKKKEVYEYGCAMLYFDFPQLSEIIKLIEPEDLYTEENSRSYGIENEPHVTLLYGLHAGVKDVDVFETISKHNIEDMIVYNASSFNNEKFDVLKFDIRYPVKGGAFLHNINQDLCKLPHTTDYPDYHPHSTIAYLKKGTASKYISILKDKEYSIKPKNIVYSKPDGTKIQKSI